MAKASGAEVFGWAMFDLANRYTTVILTVVYAVVLPKLIVGHEAFGNTLWSVALSGGVTVVLLPISGTLMDRVGHVSGSCSPARCSPPAPPPICTSRPRGGSHQRCGSSC